MSYEIRVATPDDLPEILKHLKDFSDFYGSKHELYGKNEEYNKKLILGFIVDHVFFVASSTDTKHVIGFICGFLNNHIYNPSIKVLTESFWWVSPKHRSSRAGLLLLNKFIEKGKGVADWVVMTVEHNSPVNEKSLSKRGFNLVEKSYLLEV